MAIGELEQVVLLALLRLADQEPHGALIADELETQLGRTVTPGALYTVLERLGEKGFVESWIGDSTPERGGRRRKIYRLLPAGAEELRSWYAGVRQMAEGHLGTLDTIADGVA